MKIQAKKPLLALNGDIIKDGDKKELPIGEFIANILLSSETGGKMKMYNLAEKLYKNKEVEVDASDLSIIKKAVEETKIYNNLVAGQILTILENIK